MNSLLDNMRHYRGSQFLVRVLYPYLQAEMESKRSTESPLMRGAPKLTVNRP